jgi:hypothetical protein
VRVRFSTIKITTVENNVKLIFPLHSQGSGRLLWRPRPSTAPDLKRLHKRIVKYSSNNYSHSANHLSAQLDHYSCSETNKEIRKRDCDTRVLVR